jgi:hypothetical protein
MRLFTAGGMGMTVAKEPMNAGTFRVMTADSDMVGVVIGSHGAADGIGLPGFVGLQGR